MIDKSAPLAIGSALLLSLAAAAPASTNANANRAATRDANQAGTRATQPSRRICSVEASTGTRLATRVCKTRAEWVRDEGSVPGEEN
jgi:hypothetical protein